MTHSTGTVASDQGGDQVMIYRITVKGRLSDRLTGAFGGMELVPDVGCTHLVGDIMDQAELFGVIDRLRDLSIELVRLGPIEELAS